MYIINYEGGGFVIVGATKNYYPILAYSDTNSINIEKAKQSGFSIWMDETNWAIKESDMQNAETLANMRSMWEAYEILPATTRDATSDHYSDGTMFRERLGELYTLCPGYSFGPLSSARSFLSQSDYESLVEKANFYGSPLEFTIVGYNSNNRKVGPLMNTKWGQEEDIVHYVRMNILLAVLPLLWLRLRSIMNGLNPLTGAVWLMIDRLLHLNL